MARIVIGRPSAGTWAVLLNEGTTRLGKSRDQDLRIEHASVAAQHCEIRVVRGRVFVRDLSSGFETRVDGIRVVGTTRIQDGQTLRLGQVEGRIEAEFCELEPLTNLEPLGQGVSKLQPESLALESVAPLPKECQGVPLFATVPAEELGAKRGVSEHKNVESKPILAARLQRKQLFRALVISVVVLVLGVIVLTAMLTYFWMRSK